MPKRLAATFFLLAVVVSLFSQGMDINNAIEDSAFPGKTILLVYSNDYNTEILRDFTTGFTSYISNNKVEANFRALCLDPEGRKSEQDQQRRLLKALRSTTLNGQIDLLICLDPKAESVILSLNSPLVNTIPIISCYSVSDEITTNERVHSVYTELFFEENFLLGMDLFPKTQEVLIITDDSPYGEVEQRVAKMQLEKYKSANINIRYLSPKGVSYDQFIDSINTISPNSFIILSTWNMDGDGNYKYNESYHTFIKRIKNIPILGSQNISLNSGTLGGYLVSSWNIGYLMAEESTMFLESGKHKLIDTIRNYDLSFDYKVMQKWRIRLEDLPKGATIINKPRNLFEDYKTEVIAAITIFALLALALVVFTLYHLRYRRLTNDFKKLSNENNDRKELLNNTFSVMSEGVVTFNDSLQIIDINKAAVNMAFFGNIPIIGSKFENLFSTVTRSDGASIEELLKRATEERTRFKISKNTRLFINNTSSIDIEGDITPVIDSAGEIKQVVLVFRDITKLNQQKRFLNLAVESARSYTWLYNTKSDRFEIGENYKKIFINNLSKTCTLDEFLKLIHPDDISRFDECLKMVKEKSSDTVFVEYRISFNGGKDYEWWERRGLVYTHDGSNEEYPLLYGMDINIDNHKKREAELISAKTKAEESDKLKSAFLSNMSHEIRTPLNGIIGFANLITDPDYTNDQKDEFATIINNNSKALMGLISDILDLSKIESNTMNFDIIDYDIVNQLCEIKGSYKHQVPSSIEFSVNIPDNPIMVTADPIRCRQVITNLLNNAIKFTSSGHITIGLELAGQVVRVFVEDSGKGVDSEFSEKIFMRFFKVDDFTVGTGLGLSICKAIVERFGGRIWVESQSGVGSKFIFEIPLCSSDIKEYNIEESDTLSFASERYIDSIHNGKSMLIAEDLDSNYHLLEIMLGNQFNLLRANDGLAAIDLFTTYKPDIILMDIKMPNMDGIEATKRIRLISDSVIIIAQTANAFDTDKTMALEAGCNAFVTKPIRPELLFETINKLLKEKENIL